MTETIEQRLARVEAILRADERHEMGCPKHVPAIRPINVVMGFATGLFGMPDECNCWLAAVSSEQDQP